MKNLWWGYLHISGSLEVKRYSNELEVEEALKSSFIKIVMSPFEASNREEAILIFQSKLQSDASM